MIIQRKKIHCKSWVILLLCVVVCILGLSDRASILFRAATEIGGKLYTDVMTDLSKDSEFNSEDYPALQDGKYSLNVIQIAESISGEIFVYVYEPRREQQALTATFINMSLTDSIEDTALYDLRFINANGVFCKYFIVGVTVSSADERFYNISSISREWQKDYDDKALLDNTTGYVAFPVGKRFRVTTVNNVPKYECIAQDVVEILNPFVGFIEYENGFKLYGSWCRSHIVAFSTDRHIDELLEADVEFYYQGVRKLTGYGNTWIKPISDKASMKTTLTGESKGSTGAIDGWNAESYSWERIQSVSDFEDNEDLKKPIIEALKNHEWVLRFCETEIKQYWSDNLGNPQVITSSYLCKQYTEISDVTVLRLKFEYNGITYNLGAVSDSVTGGNNPINKKPPSWWERFLIWLEDNWHWIVIGIGGVVLLIIIMPFMPAILSLLLSLLLLLLKALWWLIKHIGIALWWIITLPFRAIGALVRKIRGET